MQTEHADGYESIAEEVRVAGDEGVILGSPDWIGPFEETNKYGEPTGHAYVRCPECGVEVLTGSKEHASHRPECPHYD